jgi:hypothetical protein
MSNIDHALFQLADYPLLAKLASKTTTATHLDGRACRYLYTMEFATSGPAIVSVAEQALILTLGVYTDRG